MNLAAKQQRFCDQYLIDLNATRAYKAVYNTKNDEIAAVNASKLLRIAKIKDYVGGKQKELANKLQITKEMVIEGYRRLAFFDARKFYDEKGDLIPIIDLDDETAFALSGFEVMEEKGGNGEGKQVLLGWTKKIKMSDRKAALDSICKVLGFNAPDKWAMTDTEGNDILFKLDERFKNS